MGDKLLALGALVLGIIVGLSYNELGADARKNELSSSARRAIIAAIGYGWNCKAADIPISACKEKTSVMLDGALP